MRYQITAIECAPLNGSNFTCLFDTYSPYLYEVVFSGAKFDSRRVYRYFKVPDHDGRYFVVTHSYFGVLTFTDNDRAQTDWVIEVFKRIESGGDGNAFGFQPLAARAPFTIIERANETAGLAFCTNSQAAPLVFAQVSSLRLEIRNLSLNFSAAKVNLGNFETSSAISFKDAFQASDNPDALDAAAWWPFFLLLALLVLVALVYLAVVARKQAAAHADIEEARKYSSIEQKDKASTPAEL